MSELTYIHDYQDDEKLRKSFNKLANDTFGIDFEVWYRNGEWRDGYRCFSFAHGDEVVTNLSVSTMDFYIAGQKYTAAQVGTVMTREAYRGQGHNSELMRLAIDLYADYDMMFLFADEKAIPYYEKYGFVCHQRHNYRLKGPFDIGDRRGQTKKLCMTCPTDRAFVRRRSMESAVSKTFDIKGSEDILMWYATYYMKEDFYYIPDLDIVVAGAYEGDVYELMAVYGKKPYDLDELLPYLLSKETSAIKFAFTPDDGRSYERTLDQETIYIRSKAHFDAFEKFPELSKA